MKVLIGIPTFRRPGQLGDLLRSIQRQIVPPGVEPQIFVAENDGEGREGFALCDAMASTFQWPLDAALVLQRGIHAARNRILLEARSRGAELVAMIDDDETASPQWLAQLLGARSRYEADVVGGPVIYRFAGPCPAGLATSGAYEVKRHASGALRMFTSSANMLIDCAMLQRLGWPSFDANFGLTGGGDKEFFTRLAKGGIRFAWEEDALVFECVPKGRLHVAAILSRAYSVGSSDYRIDRLHAPPIATAQHLLRSLAVLLAAPVLAPALFFPNLRLWLLRRIARALGRMAAAIGRYPAYYSGGVSP